MSVRDIPVFSHLTTQQQKTLAERAGVDPSHLSKVFHAHTGPSGKRRYLSWEKSCALADAMGVGLDQLRAMLGPRKEPK